MSMRSIVFVTALAACSAGVVGVTTHARFATASHTHSTQNLSLTSVPSDTLSLLGIQPRTTTAQPKISQETARATVLREKPHIVLGETVLAQINLQHDGYIDGHIE